MISLIDRINNERNIDTFLTESILQEYIDSGRSTTQLNWMKIFNSKMKLSNCFVVRYVDHIKWEWLTRQIDENIIDRYSRKVVQWNAQLYGEIRTYEFIVRHKKRFDWKLISINPPSWFTDVHYEAFGYHMDWNLLLKSRYLNRPLQTTLGEFITTDPNQKSIKTDLIVIEISKTPTHWLSIIGSA